MKTIEELASGLTENASELDELLDGLRESGKYEVVAYHGVDQITTIHDSETKARAAYYCITDKPADWLTSAMLVQVESPKVRRIILEFRKGGKQ